MVKLRISNPRNSEFHLTISWHYVTQFPSEAGPIDVESVLTFNSHLQAMTYVAYLINIAIDNLRNSIGFHMYDEDQYIVEFRLYDPTVGQMVSLPTKGTLFQAQFLHMQKDLLINSLFKGTAIQLSVAM